LGKRSKSGLREDAVINGSDLRTEFKKFRTEILLKRKWREGDNWKREMSSVGEFLSPVLGGDLVRNLMAIAVGIGLEGDRGERERADQQSKNRSGESPEKRSRLRGVHIGEQETHKKEEGRISREEAKGNEGKTPYLTRLSKIVERTEWGRSSLKMTSPIGRRGQRKKQIRFHGMGTGFPSRETLKKRG